MHGYNMGGRYLCRKPHTTAMFCSLNLLSSGTSHSCENTSDLISYQTGTNTFFAGGHVPKRSGSPSLACSDQSFHDYQTKSENKFGVVAGNALELCPAIALT